jgi:hypothetical protein
MKQVNLKLLIGLFVIATTIAIGTLLLWPDSSSSPSPDVLDDDLASCQETANGYVGLSETMAQVRATKERRASRVVAKDGESFPVTDDYSPSRVNLEIRGGVVDKVTCG